MTEHFLLNLWRWKCGLPEPKPEPKPTLECVFKTNWSNKFEQLMRNRLAVGYFRYGPLHKQKKGEYNNIKSIIRRIEAYEYDGNDEYLVDIANLCMVEYLNGNHPNKHFKSIDDGYHHTERNK